MQSPFAATPLAMFKPTATTSQPAALPSFMFTRSSRDFAGSFVQNAWQSAT